MKETFKSHLFLWDTIISPLISNTIDKKSALYQYRRFLNFIPSFVN